MVRFHIKYGGVDQERPQDHTEVGLPASMLSLACCYISISREIQVIWLFVTTPETPALCCASSVNGVIPGCLSKKKLDHQWLQSWMVRDDLTTRAAAGRRADAPLIVVSGRHERPSCWHSRPCWTAGHCTLCWWNPCVDPDVLNVREYSLRSVGKAGGVNAGRRGPFEKKFWVNVTFQRPSEFQWRSGIFLFSGCTRLFCLQWSEKG